MVDLYVGPEKAHFRVHKTILCHKIPYFEKMFRSGGFVESLENKATFPEDAVESFDVLIEWVYSGVLRSIPSKDSAKIYAWDFPNFYYLLDKFCLFELMDQAMDNFRRAESKLNMFWKVKDMQQVYLKARAGSTLRLYTLHCLMYAFTMPIDRPMYEEQTRKRWSDKDILGALQAEGDLAEDFLKLLRNHYGQKVTDPRIVDDCIYHCHKICEKCSQKSKF